MVGGNEKLADDFRFLFVALLIQSDVANTEHTQAAAFAGAGLFAQEDLSGRAIRGREARSRPQRLQRRQFLYRTPGFDGAQ